MTNSKTTLVLRHVFYSLLLLVLYVVQTTPGLLVIGGVKPLLVIPAAVAIAMCEGEFVGGIYGAVAGIFCDVAGTSMFGFNGLFICLFCIGAGLAVIYLLRNNLLGCLLFVLATLLVRGSVEFLFAYGMWGHEHVGRLYARYTLPTIFFTLLLTAPVYLLIRRVHRRSAEARQR